MIFLHRHRKLKRLPFKCHCHYCEPTLTIQRTPHPQNVTTRYQQQIFQPTGKAILLLCLILNMYRRFEQTYCRTACRNHGDVTPKHKVKQAKIILVSSRCLYFVRTIIVTCNNIKVSVPVAKQSKAWVCDSWDCGFESHRGHGCLSVGINVCCQVEVSATSCSLVQRSPTDCGASLRVIYKPRE